MNRMFHKAPVASRVWFAMLLAGGYCFGAAASQTKGFAQINSTAPAQNAHSITLPHFEPELTAAPGRDEYLVVCVSCHSPRYVTMQPFFSQRQWEETVDKMAKVYGAQMDPGQRTSIVQYLVATHGPDSTRAPARDEDSDFGPVAKPSAYPENGPPLALASDGSARRKQIDYGAELFRKDCAGCHGTTGRGDGIVAPVLLRKPKDLASTQYSPALLSQVLWNGKRGTAMPAWRTLPPADLTALAAYVQSLHQATQAHDASPESLQRGNQVFQQNCAPCHGVAGDGKGAAATTLMPEPANFKLKKPNFDYIQQVLGEGIPGTAMPAWKDQIPEADQKALADFVRSLFQ